MGVATIRSAQGRGEVTITIANESAILSIEAAGIVFTVTPVGEGVPFGSPKARNADD